MMKGNIMNKFKYILSGVAAFCTVSSAAVDQNPISTGTTQTRNANGYSFEAVYHNPAILGVDKIPRGGLFVPALNFGIGVWSDKLALKPSFLNKIDSIKEGSELVSRILRRSFDLEGLSPDQVSDKLTDEFEGGVKVYAGARTSLLNGAWGRFGFDITTHFDEEVHIPEGPLFMLFSKDKGLLEGNTLDFKDFRQEAIWATDFTFHLGLPVEIPALHRLFRLQYGAGGLGIKYVMGHSILRATTEDGYIKYTNNNEIETKGKIHIQTAGFGFHGPWERDGFFDGGLPVSGHGIGVDLGGILYDKTGSLTVNVQNLGVLFWTNNVRDVTYQINKKDLDAYDIIKGIDDVGDDWDSLSLRIFNHNEGEYVSGPNDTLEKSESFVTMLPITLNIGYSRSWDNSKSSKKYLQWIADNASAGANYEQGLSRGPGRSFVPRLSIGGESGTLKGFVPLRAGFIFGGAEKIGSALGFGVNLKYFSFNASYKAIGHLLFVPKRGMELAAGINLAWGMKIDSDKDGITDKEDNCPEIPEDFDNFEDTDGCPDIDNDKDGIADTVDNCINDPEDIDSFEDDDGCPDFDNDKDEIADSLDKCPDDPEDRDNFEDSDGCPDLDNDKDNVADSIDKCPNVPEDIDSFEDADGCPDFDNDRDGIADTVDQCRNEPESFNGYKDTDGCPDTLIKPTEKETVILNKNLRSINFKTGSAELVAASYTGLDFIANFLKQYPDLRYEIQGHTDDQGSDDFNLLLSAARAGTVRAYLISKAIPESNVIAIGYGEGVPVADNKTASGRALNRRVEFKVVETNDEFNTLKIREADFNEKVKSAKIKGVK